VKGRGEERERERLMQGNITLDRQAYQAMQFLKLQGETKDWIEAATGKQLNGNGAREERREREGRRRKREKKKKTENISSSFFCFSRCRCVGQTCTMSSRTAWCCAI
jgi:hypothetical protein